MAIQNPDSKIPEYQLGHRWNPTILDPMTADPVWGPGWIRLDPGSRIQNHANAGEEIISRSKIQDPEYQTGRSPYQDPEIQDPLSSRPAMGLRRERVLHNSRIRRPAEPFPTQSRKIQDPRSRFINRPIKNPGDTRPKFIDTKVQPPHIPQESC